MLFFFYRGGVIFHNLDLDSLSKIWHIFRKHLVVKNVFRKSRFIYMVNRFKIGGNFQLDEYPWNPNFLNNTKLKQKTSNYVQATFQNS